MPAVVKPRRLEPAPLTRVPAKTLVAAPPSVRTEFAEEPPFRTMAVASPVKPPRVTLVLFSDRKALEEAPKATTEDEAPSEPVLPTMISPALRLMPPVKVLALLIVSVPVPFLIRLVEPVMPLLPCST